MAVATVASVVIQKLSDMLTEESISNEKVITGHLSEIKKALEDMMNDESFNKCAEEYLTCLYKVEDTIESFALRTARQRVRLGFLMNAFFLKNYAARRMLSRKVEKIRVKIKNLKNRRLKEVQDSRHGVESSAAVTNSENGNAHKIENFNLDNSPQGLAVSPPQAGSSTFSVQSPIASTSTTEIYEEEEEGKKHKIYIRAFSDASIHGDRYIRAFNDASIYGDRYKQAKLMYGDKINIRDFSDASIYGDRYKQPKVMYSDNFRTFSDASIYGDRYKQPRLMYSHSYYEEELDIVGFRTELQNLVTRLTNDAGGFVSIIGERGSGKTTLARAVYGTRKIKDSFDCHAWVTVSEYDVINLQRNLLKQVGKSGDRDVPTDKLKSTLFERLKDKKYLIVLDDVRSTDILEALSSALPTNTNGSKKLLITFQEEVAGPANSSPFRMGKLNDEDSRDLFLKKAGVDPQNVSPGILQACEGFPLNIILLGSFLSAKMDDEDFDRCIQEFSRRKESWEANEILSLCYNDLPDSGKLCLLYVLLFPPGLDIPVRRLLRLWQAEGFVKRPDPDEPGKTKVFPEDVAKEYFDNLVKRSLIQVSKLRSDGRPRRCRLLGVLHDYLRPMALGVRLFHIHPDSSNACKGEGIRRLVEYRDVQNCSFGHSKHGERERLRSFLSFNDQKKDTPAKEVRYLLRKIVGNGKPLLRVLDLEGLYKPSLPENLGDLFHLRYLGLRWTFLESLPQSVGDLYYLETLDVKHTYINTLPASIWKLKHLRHLNLNKIRLDMPKNMPSSIPQLLTLWGLSVDGESLVKGGLDRLVCLRELGITFQLSNSGQLLDWISKLTALQQLTLRSTDDMGNPSNLTWKPLSNLKKLSQLNLLGKLSKQPQVKEFPQEIEVLTLSVSHLTDDPMPILGQLRHLTVLRLLANSYVGTKISCKEGGFEKLRVLKLWKLEKLKEWDLEQGAMEKLKELNLRSCKSLKYIPNKLLQQKRFKELTLTNMPPELRKQVEQEKSHHIYLTVKQLSL